MGKPNCRLVRYADDWLILVAGTREDAEACARRRRRYSPRWVCACRSRRRRSPTSTTASTSGVAHPAAPQTGHQPALRLHLPGTQGRAGRDRQGEGPVPTDRHEPAARGPAASSELDAAGLVRLLPARRVQRHLQYLSAYTWRRVFEWLRRKHRRSTVKELRRRYCGGGWWPGTEERQLFNPAKVRTTRYRYRGAAIPTPLAGHGLRTTASPARGLWSARCPETGTPGAGGGSGKPTGGNTGRAPRSTSLLP